MVRPLRVLLNFFTIEQHILVLTLRIHQRLIVEMLRRRVAALTARQQTLRFDARAKFYNRQRAARSSKDPKMRDMRCIRAWWDGGYCGILTLGWSNEAGNTLCYGIAQSLPVTPGLRRGPPSLAVADF